MSRSKFQADPLLRPTGRIFRRGKEEAKGKKKKNKKKKEKKEGKVKEIRKNYGKNKTAKVQIAASPLMPGVTSQIKGHFDP